MKAFIDKHQRPQDGVEYKGWRKKYRYTYMYICAFNNNKINLRGGVGETRKEKLNFFNGHPCSTKFVLGNICQPSRKKYLQHFSNS